MWRLREEPRADAPRGSSFFKRPREPEPLSLEIGHRLLARGRVTAIKCITRAVAYENRPEPGFARRGLLRAHDVPNAVLAIEYCETVAIMYVRCTYESQHRKHANGVFWPIGDMETRPYLRGSNLRFACQVGVHRQYDNTLFLWSASARLLHERDHFWQTNERQVVLLENCPTGLRANRAEPARKSERFDNPLGKLFSIKKRREDSVLVIKDFTNGGRIGSDDEAPRA